MSKSKSLGPLFCCCIFKVQFHGSQFARSTLEPRAASSSMIPVDGGPQQGSFSHATEPAPPHQPLQPSDLWPAKDAVSGSYLADGGWSCASRSLSITWTALMFQTQCYKPTICGWFIRPISDNFWDGLFLGCHINTHNLAEVRSRPRLWALRPRAPDQLRDFLTHAIPMSACVVLDLSAFSGKSSILATHIHTTRLKEIVVWAYYIHNLCVTCGIWIWSTCITMHISLSGDIKRHKTLIIYIYIHTILLYILYCIYII